MGILFDSNCSLNIRLISRILPSGRSDVLSFLICCVAIKTEELLWTRGRVEMGILLGYYSGDHTFIPLMTFDYYLDRYGVRVRFCGSSGFDSVGLGRGGRREDKVDVAQNRTTQYVTENNNIPSSCPQLGVI